jgi:hypothetical protein
LGYILNFCLRTVWVLDICSIFICNFRVTRTNLILISL